MNIIWESKKPIQKCIFTNDCSVSGGSEKLLLIIPFSLTLCMCVLGGNCVSMWGRCQLLWVEPTFWENSSTTFDLHLCTGTQTFQFFLSLSFLHFCFLWHLTNFQWLVHTVGFGFDNPVWTVQMTAYRSSSNAVCMNK